MPLLSATTFLHKPTPYFASCAHDVNMSWQNVMCAIHPICLSHPQADLEQLEASESMGRHKEVASSTLAKQDQALKYAHLFLLVYANSVCWSIPSMALV